MLSQDEFQNTVARRILELSPSARIIPGTPPVLLVGSAQNTIIAASAYARYRAKPEQLDAIVGQVARTLLSEPPSALATFASAKPYILPLVLPGVANEDKIGRATQAFTKHLQVVYYYDHPKDEQRWGITSQLLHEWGVSLNQLHRTALVNLGKRAHWQLSVVALPTGPIVSLVPEDDYAAACMLAPRLLDFMAATTKDDLFFLAPSRRRLWGVGVHNRPGRVRLVELSSKLVKSEADALSDVPMLYRRATRRVEEWQASAFEPSP